MVLTPTTMAEFDYLQRILGTDKKNQIFSVFEHSLTKDYHVYYGAELFEIVPSDREDSRFKLMVAHLANVGIPLAKLQATFKLDPRTGNAVRTMTGAGAHTTVLVPPAQLYVISPKHGGILVLADA